MLFILSSLMTAIFIDGYCLDTLGRSHGSPIGLYPCHGEGGNQNWMTSDERQIKNENSCICADGSLTNLLQTFCSNRDECLWDLSGHRVKLLGGDVCFTRSPDRSIVLLQTCQGLSEQNWEFSSISVNP